MSGNRPLPTRGVHVSAVIGDPATYEHIDPALVGNQRRVLVSEQSGKSNILYKAREFNLDLAKDDTTAAEIVKIIKDLENCGFQFEERMHLWSCS